MSLCDQECSLVTKRSSMSRFSLRLACASAMATTVAWDRSKVAHCGASGGAKPMWIIADMDRTLVDKPPKGGYPKLDESPCFEPVLRWLDIGGRLCVVTTDGGLRTFAAIWDCIPPMKRANGHLVVCTADGASLHYGDAQGKLVEDVDYKCNALEGVDGMKGVPGLPAELMPELLKIAQDVQLAWFDDLLVDNTLMSCLGPRDKESYVKILKRVIRATKGLPLGETVDAGEPYAADDASQVDVSDDLAVTAARAKLRELFTVENLLNMGGRLKKRGSLIWRNQTGPMTAESMREMQDPNSTALFTTVIVMSVPQEVRTKYFQQLEIDKRLHRLGVEASHAPNSIWFKNPAVDKSLPVRYMLRHPDQFDFDITRAIAFGDNPGGNDEPLTRFEQQGMPFVSVSANASESPTDESRANHVGGYEFGTSVVISGLANALRPGVSSRHLLGEIMPTCQRQLASKL